jgi:nucleotide-binding universal stress UspA family protein
MAEQGCDRLAEARTAVPTEIPWLTVEVAGANGIVWRLLSRSREHAQMIVLGSRGLGRFTVLLIGSTAVSLAAQGHCPIAVVADGRPAIRRRPQGR